MSKKDEAKLKAEAEAKVVEEEKKTDERKGEAPSSDNPEEKSFDFGGLPNRDLKKNLGCG